MNKQFLIPFASLIITEIITGILINYVGQCFKDFNYSCHIMSILYYLLVILVDGIIYLYFKSYEFASEIDKTIQELFYKLEYDENDNSKEEENNYTQDELDQMTKKLDKLESLVSALTKDIDNTIKNNDGNIDKAINDLNKSVEQICKDNIQKESSKFNKTTIEPINKSIDLNASMWLHNSFDLNDSICLDDSFNIEDNLDNRNSLHNEHGLNESFYEPDDVKEINELSDIE
jgi:hypothetical protein